MPEEVKIPTKSICCAGCRAETEHSLALDRNREIVATCATCGRKLKFPLAGSPEELDAYIAAHKNPANMGQITVEMAAADQEKHDAAFFKAIGIGG